MQRSEMNSYFEKKQPWNVSTGCWAWKYKVYLYLDVHFQEVVMSKWYAQKDIIVHYELVIIFWAENIFVPILIASM